MLNNGTRLELTGDESKIFLNEDLLNEPLTISNKLLITKPSVP